MSTSVSSCVGISVAALLCFGGSGCLSGDFEPSEGTAGASPASDDGSGNDSGDNGGSDDSPGDDGQDSDGSDEPAECTSDICPDIVICPNENYVDAELISGLESDETVQGAWFVEPHGTIQGVPEKRSQLTPSAGGAEGTGSAARVAGTIQDGFLLIPLSPGQNNTGLGFDASEYAGISFWAKSGEEAELNAMKLRVPDKNTWPSYGICDKCLHDAHSKPILLESTWKRYVVPFEELVPNSPGIPSQPTVDPSGLAWIYFSPQGVGTFDIWIDEVHYVKCGS